MRYAPASRNQQNYSKSRRPILSADGNRPLPAQMLTLIKYAQDTQPDTHIPTALRTQKRGTHIPNTYPAPISLSYVPNQMQKHMDIINIAAPSSLKMHAVFPPWLAAYSKLKQIKIYGDLETKEIVRVPQGKRNGQDPRRSHKS